MDAVKFVEERRRMCKSFGDKCRGCPASGVPCCAVSAVSRLDATAQVAMVEEWSAAHQRKTRQDVFMKQWPNAKVFVDGVLDFCPRELDSSYPCQSTDIEMRCQSCRRKYWMQEVE